MYGTTNLSDAYTPFEIMDKTYNSDVIITKSGMEFGREQIEHLIEYYRTTGNCTLFV